MRGDGRHREALEGTYPKSDEVAERFLTRWREGRGSVAERALLPSPSLSLSNTPSNHSQPRQELCRSAKNACVEEESGSGSEELRRNCKRGEWCGVVGVGPGGIGGKLRRSVMGWWNGMVEWASRRSPARAQGRSWRARRDWVRELDRCVPSLERQPEAAFATAVAKIVEKEN